LTKIILDACNNHLGNHDILVAMIKEAKRLKADYIKFQLFNHERLSSLYPNYSEYKKKLEKCQIDRSKLGCIFNTCQSVGIMPMFTIFSSDRITFLEKYAKDNGIKQYAVKIASSDMSNYVLVQEVLDTFDTERFISCGMHTKQEIAAVRKHYSNLGINWLYCVSMYPTPREYIDLNEMVLFDGFSDHTNTTDMALKALSLGIQFLEMHFTLGRSLPCKDSIVSKVPSEIEKIVHYRDYLASIDNYKHRFL
jgi:sialic acid synthase SpsE